MNHANDPVDETAWIQNMVDEYPDGNRISGFVAYADLIDANIALTVERHSRHAVFKGVRQEIWWEELPSRPDKRTNLTPFGAIILS